MSSYFTLLVSFGLLAPCLVAVGAVECSEKETLLRLISSTVTKVTDCLMECTGMTYVRKLQLQDHHNIRLKDSTEGKEAQSDILTLCCSQTQKSYPTWTQCWEVKVLYLISVIIHHHLSPQGTSVNTAGLRSSSAPLERAFTVPTWCCLWIYLQLHLSSLKSKSLLRLPPRCASTAAPPQSQTHAASATMSRSISAQRRQGYLSAYRLSPRKTSWGTKSLNVLPIWSPSGRGIPVTPTNKAVAKKSYFTIIIPHCKVLSYPTSKVHEFKMVLK